MNFMQFISIAACFLSVLCPDATAADDLEPRIRTSRWQRVTAPPRHLKLREGRVFYRGPRSLMNRYPYYLAASTVEKGKGFGYELRVSNAHRLFEPILSPLQARELARILSGGILVPDARTWEKMRAEAVRLKPEATGWGITVKKGNPGVHGITVSQSDAAFTVSMLVYTCSGYSRLSVVEKTVHIPVEGPVQAKTREWITGPPQSWQTSGPVDAAEQRALREEVRRFRAAMSGVFAGSRTLDAVRSVLSSCTTFAAVRRELGEPDRTLGSGITIHVYGLNDGTAVLFGVPKEDEAPVYVRHVSQGTPGEAAKAGVGRVLQELLKKK